MRMLFCAAVATVFLMSLPAGAAISEDLVFCSKLTAPKERLACYDAAARIERLSASGQKRANAPSRLLPPPSAEGFASVERPDLHSSNFSGAYVFGYGGYAPSLNSIEYGHLNLTTFGAGLGYNHVDGKFLIGIEARGANSFGRNVTQIEASDVISPFPIVVSPGTAEPVVGYKRISDRKFSAGVGGDISMRFGLIDDDWLFYGKIGAGLQDMVLAYDWTDGPYVCINPARQPGSPEIIIGCGEIRDDSVKRHSAWSGIATYLVAGIGVERNYGQLFARLEGEVKSFGPTFAYATGGTINTSTQITLPSFISFSANAAVGYRF
ncbi:MAG: hypothetical protein AB7V13_05595 [Pseudorhodoplanes sp.]|uniref:hypothetical protein n=1 Tax=Pseudorhodoplanes sp. TaxID=1934341 RepID=UPI003D12E882